MQQALFFFVRGVSGVIDSVSRICTRMAYTGVPYFQMGGPKNLALNHHQIFRVCSGHKVGHNDTVLREFDKGILRGEGGRTFFDPQGWHDIYR